MEKIINKKISFRLFEIEGHVDWNRFAYDIVADILIFGLSIVASLLQ